MAEREEEHNLFGGISLSSDEYIDIPDGIAPVEPIVDTDDPTKTKEKTKEKPEDTGFIEIPDAVSHQDVTEEATKDDEEDSKDKGKKQASSSSPFKPLAKALFETGVLSSFEEDEYDELVKEFDGDEALALIELNKRTIESEIKAYKEEGEAEYAAFLEARDAGVDLNDWASVQDNKKRLSKIDDDSLTDDVKLQKQLIKEDLEKRGFDTDEIVDTIESYEDTNKLLQKSRNALKNLLKHEDAKEESLKTAAVERDKQVKEAVKKQKEDLKKEITSTDEIIPGLKLKKTEKDELFDSIMKPVKVMEDGRQINAVMAKRIENPIKYAILEAYFVKQGFFDMKFDKLVSKTKSKAVEELHKVIASGGTDYKPGKTALEDDGIKEFEVSFGRI